MVDCRPSWRQSSPVIMVPAVKRRLETKRDNAFGLLSDEPIMVPRVGRPQHRDRSRAPLKPRPMWQSAADVEWIGSFRVAPCPYHAQIQTAHTWERGGLSAACLMCLASMASSPLLSRVLAGSSCLCSLTTHSTSVSVACHWSY